MSEVSMAVNVGESQFAEFPNTVVNTLSQFPLKPRFDEFIEELTSVSKSPMADVQTVEQQSVGELTVLIIILWEQLAGTYIFIRCSEIVRPVVVFGER
jgi:hypothetical protein